VFRLPPYSGPYEVIVLARCARVFLPIRAAVGMPARAAARAWTLRALAPVSLPALVPMRLAILVPEWLMVLLPQRLTAGEQAWKRLAEAYAVPPVKACWQPAPPDVLHYG
jgi:hypothetical protein